MSEWPVLNREVARRVDAGFRGPARTETIVQFGEGVFLRGFFLPMVDELNRSGRFEGSVVVVKPRPGRAVVEKLAAQEGVYTVLTRGKRGGVVVDERRVVGCVSRVMDPADHWEQLRELFRSRELQVVVSNTTEAGLRRSEEDVLGAAPPVSFPGKVTALLWERFRAGREGLCFLPTELVEDNGVVLRREVLETARMWGLPREFVEWVEGRNAFVGTLVDRIVSGAGSEAGEWWEKLGYRDEFIAVAEPFHFLAMEDVRKLREMLPLEAAEGFGACWTRNVAGFRQRKVRILNGLHALLAPLGLLAGVETVGEAMGRDEFRVYLERVAQEEIVPTVAGDREDNQRFIRNTLVRFSNPFLRHRLADIAMNLPAKWRVRLLPVVKEVLEREERVPGEIALGLAAMLEVGRRHREWKLLDSAKDFELIEKLGSRHASAADFVAAALDSEALGMKEIGTAEFVEATVRELEQLRRGRVLGGG